MEPSQSIFLVGPMGVGKTTIGRQLAELLDYEFVDSDKAIEERTGASIPWIFDVEGEEGFRKREQAILDELTSRPSIVLATGGGAVINEQNRSFLKNRGFVVYLRAGINELLQRTQHDKHRPLLQTDNPRQKLQELIEQREPWYTEVADLVFETKQKNSHASAKLLLQQINAMEK